MFPKPRYVSASYWQGSVRGSTLHPPTHYLDNRFGPNHGTATRVMATDTLRAELERLFELDELLKLSRDFLGFEPEEIGGTSARASFAGALTEYCVRADAVEALCDALLAARADVDPSLQELRLAGLPADDELPIGTELGPYTLAQRIGDGRLGVCYGASHRGEELRVKVLRREATRDRRGLHRFLTVTRLAGAIDHPGLARFIEARAYGDRYAVVHSFVEGQPLSQRLGRMGSMHMTEMVPLVRSTLTALKALHDRRIAHGDLRSGNVIVCQPGEGSPFAVLLDAGTDRLRARARVGNGRSELFSTVAAPESVAPEQIRGVTGDLRSDLYSLGILLFEMATGRPPFTEGNALDIAYQHLSKKPPAPSSLAPRGWIPDPIDQLILALLRKDPGDRPQTVDKVLAAFETGSIRPPAPLEGDAVSRRTGALLADPANADLAGRLEETVESGADPLVVAGVLMQAAEYLDLKIADLEAGMKASGILGDEERPRRSSDFDLTGEVTGVVSAGLQKHADPSADAQENEWSIQEDAPEPASRRTEQLARTRSLSELKTARNGLLFRAARVLARSEAGLERAEQVYERLVALDPQDLPAANALEDIRRRLGKFEAIIETLLAKSESAASPIDRARAFAEIGRVYATDLRDLDQAVVAYTQAVCEDPSTNAYVREVERLARTKPAAWGEVVATVAGEAARSDSAPDQRVLLHNLLAHWYISELKRPDLALPCFQAAAAIEPSNETALSGLTDIYRQAQAHAELAQLLLQRAESAPTPARARDLHAEAARILAYHLNAPQKALELLEAVLQDDPSHAEAAATLVTLYEHAQNYEALVRLLETRAAVLGGQAGIDAACQAAEIYADRLARPEQAIKHFERALREDPNHLPALRGLDRAYSATGRFRDVLDVVERQIDLAPTPRQKIGLWQRVAGIYDEEFHNHERAADAWEAVLDLDSANELALSELARHCRALDRWLDVERLYGRYLKLVTDPLRRFELALARAQVLDEQLGLQDRAIEAFEAALALYPEHPVVLEALARLRQATGDADSALAVIEALALKANTPEGRAEQHLKAARLLEQRGDRDRAIDAYKRALDACPGDLTARLGLREVYLAGGDVSAALQLMEHDVERTEGDRAKAKVLGEIAVLARERLGDNARAGEAGRRALALDPTNLDALRVLGDIAFENEHFVEAIACYEALVDRAESLDSKDATRLLVRYIDALCQSGAVDRSATPIETLKRIAPLDADALGRVAELVFTFGEASQSAELYGDHLSRFESTLSAADRGRALHRYGESLVKTGRAEAALEPLNRAADLDESNALPLVTLAQAHEALGDWEEAIRIKNRELDLADEDRRERLLVEIGEIAAEKLEDRTRAAKSFVVALEMRPDDRRLLTKLMQLYGEEKDWNKLVDVVLRLAEFVAEPDQKAKYLHTAAKVTARQIGDVDHALQYYEQVLGLNPDFDRALDEVVELERDRGNYKGLERALRRKLAAALRAEDRPVTLRTFDELGAVYRLQLQQIEPAIEAYEAAQGLDPDNRERANILSELYVTDPAKYLDRVVGTQALVLEEDPYRAESYKLLRRLYTETRNADASWCLCQTLSVLNLAEPDEERFYQRMRSETAAPAQTVLSEELWTEALLHPWVDPVLTRIFAIIEPAILARRGETFEKAGYYQPYALDLANHYAPLAQNLYYAAGVLGLEPPLAFENPQLAGGLLFLHTQEPAMVLGAAALSPEVPPQAAAFIASRHLTYYRPGLYLRQLLQSGTGLKSWLFAAIKLVSPQFPMSPELEGSVREGMLTLDAGLKGQARDQLASVVQKVLQASDSLDLRRWVAGVDLSADRVGLLIAHDLRTAFDLVKATHADGVTAVSSEQRLRELALFSVSASYFKLRDALGIRVDA